VISASEDSNKFPKKPGFGRKKSVEDVVTLGPTTAQATLVQIISRVYVTCLCLGVEKTA
jgi:hypothetical protein